MRILSMIVARARALVRGAAVDRELAHEMSEHLQHLVDEHVARGMTPDAARAAARREFGSVAFLMDESRDTRGIMWLANAWHDVRYGIRLMSRAPGFAAVVILTISLVIGATTAMFSVVYSVLLQPLPYREPERLVNLWTTAPKRGLPRANVGTANVVDWRARARRADWRDSRSRSTASRRPRRVGGTAACKRSTRDPQTLERPQRQVPRSRADARARVGPR